MNPLTILWAQADDNEKANLALTFLTRQMDGIKAGQILELKIETEDDKKFKVSIVEES
jgi:hypothetical protein